MKRMIIAAVLVATAGQASALSCVAPDIAATFSWAAESDEAYLVVLGEFSISTAPPVQGITEQPESYTVPATFEGQILGVNGFAGAYEFEVLINVDCLGPWCGAEPATATPTIAFLLQAANGYVLNAGPCFGDSFAPARADDIRRVEACMRGESCEPAG